MTQPSKLDSDLLYESYLKSACDIVQYFDNQERKELLTDLKDSLLTFVNENEKLKRIEEIEKRMLNMLQDNSTDSAIEDLRKQYIQELADLKVDSSNDPRLIEFDKQVSLLLGETVTDEDGDMEMQMTINVIDPISKKRMTEPVKNIVCGHVYEKSSIMDLLKVNKQTRCPVIGCTDKSFVKQKNLLPDVVTKLHLEKNLE